MACAFAYAATSLECLEIRCDVDLNEDPEERLSLEILRVFALVEVEAVKYIQESRWYEPGWQAELDHANYLLQIFSDHGMNWHSFGFSVPGIGSAIARPSDNLDGDLEAADVADRLVLWNSLRAGFRRYCNVRGVELIKGNETGLAEDEIVLSFRFRSPFQHLASDLY